jgi:hypothetical protein
MQYALLMRANARLFVAAGVKCTISGGFGMAILIRCIKLVFHVPLMDVGAKFMAAAFVRYTTREKVGTATHS